MIFGVLMSTKGCSSDTNHIIVLPHTLIVSQTLIDLRLDSVVFLNVIVRVVEDVRALL